MAEVKLSCQYGMSHGQLYNSAFHTGKEQRFTSVVPSPSCWLLTMNMLVIKAVWANSPAAVYAIFSVLSPVCACRKQYQIHMNAAWDSFLPKPYLQYLLLAWRGGRRRKRRLLSRHNSPAAKPYHPACPTSQGCPAPGPSHKQALPWGEVMKR